MSNLTNRSNLTQVQGTTTQYTLSPVLVGPSWKQLSVGSSHVIAIRSNDTLWAWGNNSSGQLGDGTYITRSSPVLIGGVYTWKSASAGGSHSLAVRNDGIMFAWGDNSMGQLGNNRVPYSNIWKQISSIISHTLLIRNDNTLWAVGVNTNGELGDGTVTTRPSPVQIGTSKYIAISAGSGMSYAITEDNRLFAWGYNGSGQLGTGDVVSRSSPVQVPGSWTQVTSTATEWYANNTWPPHTGAINTQGQLFMWGSNSYGQLGDGTGVTRSSPVQVAGNRSWSQVSAGSSFTLGITTDKTLWGWGVNTYGQQGNPNPTDRSSPVQISAMPMWEKVTAGRDYGAGVTTGGALWAWGFNTDGQLGDGTNVTKYTITKIFENGIKDVNAHTLSAAVGVLTTDNRLLMSGLNSSGQLGDGTTINRSVFTQIGTDNNWSSIVRGNNGSLGLKTDGTLWGWGRDATYQVFFGITDGTPGGYRSSPVQTGAVSQSVSPVKIGTSSWTQVSAGTDHSLAIRSDKTLWAFGNNSVGQLIQAGVISTSSPIQVGTSSYSQISAGNSFSLAITTDGALYGAGNNTYGQAGASLVSTTYSWTTVATTMFHTLAIRNDGLLFSWGGNAQGQLGDGTTLDRSSPVQIGSNSWISVATNANNSNISSFSLAVRQDGTVWSWGTNAFGQLGDGTTINKSSPVQVGSLSGMTKVAAGWQHSLVIGSSGLWAWGSGGSGQLGQGETINRSSPVQISTFSFTQIAAGWASSVAIRNDGLLFSWGGGTTLGAALGLNDTLGRSVITQVGTSSWTKVFSRSGGTEALVDTYWAIRSDGKLFGWGYNGTYAIGDGTSINRSSPVQVGAVNWTSIASTTNTTPNTNTFGTQSDGSVWAWGLKNAAFGVDNATTTFTYSWIQVSSGSSHSMFLRSDYTLWGTGANTLGQVGLNDAVNRSSPVQVGTSAWKAVSAGGAFTLALDSNNILWSWGNNTAGQLGQAGSDTKSSPVQVNSTSWNSISAGYSHSLAIDTTGGLYTWGSNSYKQLGQVTPIYSNALSWTKVRTGLYVTTFIRSDGMLFTTGANNYGQLGDGTTIYRSSPTQIGSGSWLTAVPTQDNGVREMVVAINSLGKLFTWGASITGLLGDNSTSPRSSPVQIGNSSWSQVETAGNRIFAIRADNTLWAWGKNENGSFGVPTYNLQYSSPIQIGTNNYSKIAVNKDIFGAGLAYTLAIDTAGKLYAWGSNSTGALGQGSAILTSWIYTATGNDYNSFAISADGTLYGWGQTSPVSTLQIDDGLFTNKSSPVLVGLLPNTSSHLKFSKVAPGFHHVYAIATDGALYQWGQPPSNAQPTYIDPIVPLIPTYSWTQISGGVTILAIRSDGKLFAWGTNAYGSVGDGTSTSKSAPVQIGNSSWSAIAASGYGYQSLAIDAVGRLFAWGYNGNGQVGDNTTTNRNSPVQILSGYSFTKVASSAYESFAIRADGLLFGWGQNLNGALGVGDTVKRSSPVQISSRKYIDIAASDDASGNSTTYMIRDDYKLFTVGKNLAGQLADGTTVDRSSPVQVGTSSWTMVRPGSGQVAAIDTLGRLFTWGGYVNASLGTTSKSWTYVSLASGQSLNIDNLGRMFAAGPNDAGQLGDNSVVFKSSPVQVGTNTSWSQVATGATHTVAMASDGTVWTWGAGFWGQLGNSTTINRSSPVQISADRYIKIRAGQATSGGINSQGQLFLWGDNSWGMMGDSTTSSRSQPVQVGIGPTWTDFALGTSHVAALTSDNRLFMWGANINGQLGQNNTIHRSSPVQVPGSWSQITIGGNGAAYALDMSGTLYAWGFNSDGQLGQNDTLSRSSPVQVSAGYPGAISFTGTSSIASTTTINFGAGLFTVEGWFYRTSAVGTNTTFWGTTNGTGLTTKIIFLQASSGSLTVWQNNAAVTTTSTTLVPQNTWVHIAVVRDTVAPGIIKVYVNGQLQAATTNPSNDYSGLTGTFNIGADGESAYSPFPGSISNFRVVTGVAVYTDNFTVPTTPLQPSQSSGTNINAITVSQTQLLVASNAPNIYDASAVRRPITLTNASYSGASPLTYKWTQIIGSYQTIHAKATDNTLWGWGYNVNGQLAMNDSISRSSPVQLAAFSSYIVNLNTHNFIQNASMANAMGVLVDNGLLLWGYNSLGGLGDGTTIAKSNPIQIGCDIFRSSPVQVGSLSWTNVSANWYSMVGTTTDGVLRGWGYNLVGQLGTGDRANRGLPTVLNTTAPSFISSSGVGNTTFYIYSGNLYGVGYGSSGVLGYNSTVSRSSPVQIATEPRTISKILNGSSFTQVTTYLHTAAIKTDGTLWMWGYNNYGQLGDGTTISKLSPIQVPGSWSQVAINIYTTVGLKTDGSLWAWGDNTSGQLADSTTIHRSSPVQLVSGSSFTQIAANWGSVYAIKPNFTLWAWGRNDLGQLGDNSTAYRSSPVQVSGVGTSSWTQVRALGYMVLAQSTNGALYGSGTNGNGQLGDNTTASKSVLTLLAAAASTSGVFILPPSTPYDGNGANARVIAKNGTLYAWGYNNAAQVGNLTSGTAVSSPVVIAATFDYMASPLQIGTSSWSQVSAGGDHVAAVTTDGKMFTWGANAAGQLGGGADMLSVAITPDASGTSTGAFSALIRGDGGLFMTGANALGNLGDGTAVSKVSPVQIGTNEWKQVAIGFAGFGGWTLALKQNGSLWAWGTNTSYNLADGTSTSKSSPIAVGGTNAVSNWVSIGVAQYTGYAINTLGELWAWGNNLSGQAGTNGGGSYFSFPTKVGTDTNWKSVSAGAYATHVFAIKTDNTLWAWGNGVDGRLGDGGNAYRSSPVQIPGSWIMTSVGGTYTAGDYTSYGIKTDYTMWAWGNGSGGILGDNTTNGKNSPVQIGAAQAASWLAVHGHAAGATALSSDGTLWYWGVSDGSGNDWTGNTIARSSPTQLSTTTLFRNFTNWERYRFSKLWITQQGNLLGWGWNSQGQLAQNNTTNYSSPVQVGAYNFPTASYLLSQVQGSWSQVAAGTSSTIATRTDATLWSWGYNINGQIADNTTASRSSPVQIGNNYWTRISSAAGDHVAGIKADGSLWMWGNNNNGQLGFSNTFSRSSPVQLGTSSWTQVFANARATHAIDSTGRLFAWGNNTFGQLGLNDTVWRSSPVQVGALTTWSRLTGGAISAPSNQEFTVALNTAGQLFTWGCNTNGQLGDNATVNRSSPVQIMTTSSFTTVSSSNFHTMALSINRGLYLFGLNQYGQLGDNTTLNRSSPVQVGTSQWTNIAAGTVTSAAIDTNGRLFTWGYGGYAGLGDGTTINRSSPVQVGTSTWANLFTTGLGFAAINPGYNRLLYVWGVNNTGQLGNNSTVNLSSITLMDNSIGWELVTGGTDITAGFAGDSLGIKDGKLFAWGSNIKGNLGQNDTISRSTPTQINTYNSWTVVDSNISRTSMIRSDGQLFGAGYNVYGQLGDGTAVNRSSPVQIGTSYIRLNAVPTKLDNNSYTQISSGEHHSMAIRNDSTLWGWGLNIFNVISDANTPKWSKVFGGGNQGAAITTLGELYVWGDNSAGGLGINNATAQTTPVKFDSNSWTTIALSSQFGLAIRADGTLWSWGNNANGQLGTNDPVAVVRSSPTQIGTSNNWIDVAVGYGTSLAINSLNQLWAWGSNNNGSVGDGTVVARSSPVQIPGSWASLVQQNPDSFTSGAIKPNGTLWMWGYGANGELGDNTIAAKSSPVQVAGSWLMAASGATNTMGIKYDGTLWGWGINTYGGLGQTNTINRSSPVQVTVYNYKRVVAGTYFSMALRADNTVWGMGYNAQGQLGQNDLTNRSSPVQISTSAYSYISSGGNGLRAIFLDNTLASTGLYTGNATTTSTSSLAFVDTSFTQLASNPISFVSSPTQIGASWSSVSTNFKHAMAIKPDGTLWAWGGNSEGQLGYIQPAYSSITPSGYTKTDGTLWTWGFNVGGWVGDLTTASRSSPVQITTGALNWSKLSVSLYSSPGSYGHRLAIDNRGNLYAWGLNTYGQLGTNDNTSRTSPVQIAYLRWIDVANDLALKEDKTLWTWGYNQFGQLGDGTTISRSSPVQIGNSSWAVIGGSRAIRIDGTLWSWGDNTFGGVGDNTTINRSSPVQVGLLSNWKFLSRNSRHAINNVNQLFGWGNNESGRIGDNSTAYRSSPVQIGAGINFLFVESEGGRTVALDNLGRMYSWGYNTYGGVGDGTTIDRSSPVQIGTSSWAMVAVSGYVTLAIRIDGTLWAWGRNDFGEIGNNDTIHRSSPVQVGTDIWQSIYAVVYNVFGVRNNQLYVWGRNTSGQLGLNDTINRSSPVQVSTSEIPSKIGGSNDPFVLTQTGRLIAWGGTNSNGRLGLGDTIARSSPVQIGTSGMSWTQISASTGGDFSAAIKDDGTLWTWGSGYVGQLGDNTRLLYRSAPIQIPGSWNQVAAVGDINWGFTLAIKSDNTLWTWGSNTSGQLGSNTGDYRSSPVQVGTSSWNMVAGSVLTAGAIDINGRLFLWGANGYGQLGLNDTIDRSSPVQVMTDKSFVQLAVSNRNAFAIDTLGRLWATGNGAYGAGNPSSTADRSSPVQVGTESWMAVVASGFMVSALRMVDGIPVLFSWGDNSYGILGDNSVTTRYSPVMTTALYTSLNNTFFSSPVQVGLGKSWLQVSAGPYHTVALRNDYTMWSWGMNYAGQVGTTDTVYRSSPTQIGTSSWINVNAGGDLLSYGQTFGVSSTGLLYGWGQNNFGQLGDTSTAARSAPLQVATQTMGTSPIYPINLTSTRGSSYTQVGYGLSYATAIKNDGTLWAWGNNTYGQLGQLTTISSLSVLSIGGTSIPYVVGANKIGNSSWSQVSAGGTHALALNSTGNLYGWGNFAGNPSISSVSWKTVAIGYPNLAIKPNGTLWVWGYNNNGQLGDGTTINRSSPVQIGSDTDWVYVASAVNQSAAIKSDGRLFMWGDNTQGRLANGDTISRSSPVQVPGSWSQVSLGLGNHFGQKVDGTWWGWGTNTLGTIGDSTTINKSSPVQVAGNWNKIIAGQDHTTGILYDGTAWAWGNNTYGALGLNDTVARSTPLQIGVSKWVKVNAGDSFTVALRADGTLWSWGLNTSGQLGLTDIVSRSSPTQIGTSYWTSISTTAFASASFAFDINNVLYGWGVNGSGQLGDNSGTLKSSPVQIGSGLSFKQIFPGNTAGAIDLDNNLYLWGYGGVGGLMNISTGNILSPVLVTTGLDIKTSSPVQIAAGSWVHINAGTDFSIAVDTNNSLYFWGKNDLHQSGSSSPARIISSPVQIGSSATDSGAGSGTAGFVKNI